MVPESVLFSELGLKNGLNRFGIRFGSIRADSSFLTESFGAISQSVRQYPHRTNRD